MSETTNAIIGALNDASCKVRAAELGRITRNVHAARGYVEELARRRRETILALHAEGWTYRRIGELTGITPEAVYAVVKKG